MKQALIAALLVASFPVAANENPGADRIDYEIAAVEGKLFLVTEPEERRLSIGNSAASGDRLRTGGSSSTIIGVPTHTVVFKIDAKTSFVLAHDRPGVLLHIEKGRIRAIFGSYTGTDPRLVTTPSAVLAVRGTDYGVRVKKNGETQVVVFEGLVEIRDPAGESPPIRVEAGQQSRIKPGRPAEAPTPHRLTPHSWNQGHSTAVPGMGAAGSNPGSPNGSFGSSGAGSSKSGSGSKRRGG